MAKYTVRGMGAMPGFDLGPDRDNGPNVNVHIEFPNGVILSLVMGWGAYAGPDTVEAAVMLTGLGGFVTREVAKATFGEDLDDDVDGFCDADRVHDYFLAAQAWDNGEG